VYKLQELAAKYPVFALKKPPPLRALDLGAAPGSWSLYLLRTMREKINLTACDMAPLCGALSGTQDGAPVTNGNFSFLQGDFTTANVRNAIMDKAPFDVIISDAAPATTGNRLVDTARSEELARAVLEYARAALRPEGSLVVKVFQGGGSADFLRDAKRLFSKSAVCKPKASRPESFETYFTGLGKK
jgi:23S rRNA (uridine2552-2'-O)-methyltransferase